MFLFSLNISISEHSCKHYHLLKNRGFSTVHAVFVSIASFYLLMVSDIFNKDLDDGPVIDRSSTLSNTVFGVSWCRHSQDLVVDLIVAHGILIILSSFCCMIWGQLDSEFAKKVLEFCCIFLLFLHCRVILYFLLSQSLSDCLFLNYNFSRLLLVPMINFTLFCTIVICEY